MSNIISARVPWTGPTDYKMMIVGEAPGAEEAAQGKPFIGKSGQVLTDYLNRNGVDREEVKICNLFNYRPKGNKFELILGESVFEEELDRLAEEINRAKPNVIVAMGGWPMYYLTGACGTRGKKKIPGSGMTLYRGSRLPSVKRFGDGIKVFCSMHPAYVIRNWAENPIFNIDLAHAIEESKFPELRYPEYDEYIDPEGDICYHLVKRALASGLISIDIETFPDHRFSCVGFSWQENGRDIGVCITYKAKSLWMHAREIWESDVPKVFQYGTYDISFMRFFYDWRIGGYYDAKGWDTYVASSSIMPNFPRGLDFLCSLYTRFPYYKTERKVWKEVGDMNILWRYNIKDCIATMQIALQQMEEVKSIFKRIPIPCL